MYTSHPSMAEQIIRIGAVSKFDQSKAIPTRVTCSQNQNRPRSPASSMKSPTMATARSSGAKSDNTHSAIRSLRMRDSREHDAIQQPCIIALQTRHRGDAFCGNGQVALGPPPALRSGISQSRRDHAFFLQTIQGGVESAGRRLAAGAGRDLLAKSDGIGSIAEPQNCHQNGLLEFTKSGRHDLYYKIAVNRPACQSGSSVLHTGGSMLHRRARIGDIICEFMFEQSFGSKDSRRPRWFAGAVAVFIVLTIIPGMETYAVITG